MLLLLSPAKDLLSVSHLWVTEDPGHSFHFCYDSGVLAPADLAGLAPNGPGKKFDFLPLVTGHWHSILPTGVRGSSEALLHPQLRVYVGATLANTK
jgi:hypothetical protein